MNGFLFPMHNYRMMAPQSSYVDIRLPSRSNYLLPSQLPNLYRQKTLIYYPPVPIPYPFQLSSASYPIQLSPFSVPDSNDPRKVDLVLIAILLLVSLDLIFVRPSKKQIFFANK